MKITSKDGIFYKVSRKGAEGDIPIVLVHGAGGDHLHWPSEIRRMEEMDVYAIDLPGHGRSEGGSIRDVSEYAEVVSRWMENAWVDKAVLVGHSMGGAIAQTTAIKNPEKITGLVLVSTGMKLPVNAELLEALKDGEKQEEAVRKIVGWSFMRGTDEKILSEAEKQLLRNREGVLYGDYLACSKFDLREKVGEINTPTLSVCGEKDIMTPIKFSEGLQEQIRGSKMEIVPETGHMLPLENAQGLAKLIQKFIKNL